MRNLKLFSYFLISSTFLLMPVSADDKDNPALKFGAGLSYVIPGGHLSDIASGGYGLSVFAKKPLDDNLAVRGIVDYINYGNKTDKYDVYVKHDVSQWGLAVDGIWSFTGHDAGLYAIVRLGFQKITDEITNDQYSVLKSSSGLVYGAGLGYDFGRISIEVICIFGPDRNWLIPENYGLPKLIPFENRGLPNWLISSENHGQYPGGGLVQPPLTPLIPSEKPGQHLGARRTHVSGNGLIPSRRGQHQHPGGGLVQPPLTSLIPSEKPGRHIGARHANTSSNGLIPLPSEKRRQHPER